MTTAPRLAVFVSPHGFGHAARAASLMGALHGLSGARFEVFATTPTWFFDESVEGLYRYHSVVTDVGLHQHTALAHDGAATVAALDRLLPYDTGTVQALARQVVEAGCRGVLCDIAPLGIAVAEAAGLPSVLVENFTWPWLYEPLYAESPGLEAHGRMLAAWFHRATYHVQTEPLCRRDPEAGFHAPPMGRTPRVSREETRGALGIPDDARVVVLTMGGVPEALPFLEELKTLPEVTFLVTGARETCRDANLRLFDNDTRIYMPDLVRAADAVVAKAGYSTIAEVWNEGRPLAYVTREDFRETAPLRAWLQDHVPGFEIPGRDFAGGDWIQRVPELLTLDERREGPRDGAGRVAGYLAEVLGLGATAGVSPEAGR